MGSGNAGGRLRGTLTVGGWGQAAGGENWERRALLGWAGSQEG